MKQTSRKLSILCMIDSSWMFNFTQAQQISIFWLTQSLAGLPCNILVVCRNILSAFNWQVVTKTLKTHKDFVLSENYCFLVENTDMKMSACECYWLTFPLPYVTLLHPSIQNSKAPIPMTFKYRWMQIMIVKQQQIAERSRLFLLMFSTIKYTTYVSPLIR